jgi:hypothetical protein
MSDRFAVVAQRFMHALPVHDSVFVCDPESKFLGGERSIHGLKSLFGFALNMFPHRPRHVRVSALQERRLKEKICHPVPLTRGSEAYSPLDHISYCPCDPRNSWRTLEDQTLKLRSIRGAVIFSGFERGKARAQTSVHRPSHR